MKLEKVTDHPDAETLGSSIKVLEGIIKQFDGDRERIETDLVGYRKKEKVLQAEVAAIPPEVKRKTAEAVAAMEKSIAQRITTPIESEPTFLSVIPETKREQFIMDFAMADVGRDSIQTFAAVNGMKNMVVQGRTEDSGPYESSRGVEIGVNPTGRIKLSGGEKGVRLTSLSSDAKMFSNRTLDYLASITQLRSGKSELVSYPISTDTVTFGDQHMGSKIQLGMSKRGGSGFYRSAYLRPGFRQ